MLGIFSKRVIPVVDFCSFRFFNGAYFCSFQRFAFCYECVCGCGLSNILHIRGCANFSRGGGDVME
jgi:hypothetical protein